MTDIDIVMMVRWLRQMAETVPVVNGVSGNRYELTAEMLRGCLPPDHPMHPNQDGDDVPELGDPRA